MLRGMSSDSSPLRARATGADLERGRQLAATRQALRERDRRLATRAAHRPEAIPHTAGGREIGPVVASDPVRHV